MKHMVVRYEDRVSVSFFEEGKDDHDVIVTVTFDMRVVRELTDDGMVEKAWERLETMVLKT